MYCIVLYCIVIDIINNICILLNCIVLSKISLTIFVFYCIVLYCHRYDKQYLYSIALYCIVTDINNNICIVLYFFVLSQISITKECRLRLNWGVFRSGKQTFTLRWAINQIESFKCKNTTYKQHITTQNSIISKLLPSLSSSWEPKSDIILIIIIIVITIIMINQKLLFSLRSLA